MYLKSLKDSGKVFAVRLRRLTKNGRTRRDGSIPADTPSPVPVPSSTLPSNSSPGYSDSAGGEPGLEGSTNHDGPSAGYSRGVSLAREASDMAQLALPLVQAVVGAIPLVGPSMQAAIGGLLTSLQAIDRHNQNKADLNSLALRLDRLSRDLCNAPPARDSLEQSRRDSFVRMLQDTSARTTVLHKRCLASTSVTQAITGCFIDIDRYLAEYLLSSQMQSQHDIHEELIILRRQQEDQQKLLMTMTLLIREQSSVGLTATQLTGSVALGCVTLVDATGHEHPISVNFCTSFQQLNEMLHVLFKRDSIEARIQRQFIEIGQYDLCIDNGMQVTQLTSHGWSGIEPGTRIVMRVIIEQQETSSSRSGVSYTCRFCRAENHLSLGSVMYSLARQAGCSIDCRVCKRRFYISRVSRRAKRNTRSSNIDSNHTTEAEMHLIRNFHVQQTSISSASTSTSNSSVRSVSETATGGSRRAGGQVSQMPKNVKIMSGVPWELDELPRQRHPNAVGDIFGSPPQRKSRTRKSKLDMISETPKKVQMGQSNALAKMLSALRR